MWVAVRGEVEKSGNEGRCRRGKAKLGGGRGGAKEVSRVRVLDCDEGRKGRSSEEEVSSQGWTVEEEVCVGQRRGRGKGAARGTNKTDRRSSKGQLDPDGPRFRNGSRLDARGGRRHCRCRNEDRGRSGYVGFLEGEHVDRLVLGRRAWRGHEGVVR